MLDVIGWKMKYTELICNVYVLKEIIDSFKECVGLNMKEVEAIIDDICLNLISLPFKRLQLLSF